MVGSKSGLARRIMNRLSPVLAYHVATRRAYLFVGQTEAARWLVSSGLCKGTVSTARSNLIAASEWPHRGGTSTSTRLFHGFAWVRGSEVVAVLMDKLIRRLRVWALMDAVWQARTDADLTRALNAAGIADPAAEPTVSAPLASGVRFVDGLPEL